MMIMVGPHHAEGLVDPKVSAQKKATDFGYPRACIFRKYQIENRFLGAPPKVAPPTNFFQNVIFIS
jgi:hypothetical protein